VQPVSSRAAGKASGPHPGRIIAATRALLGQPAEQLAATAGLSKHSLSRLERGHRAAVPGELAGLLRSLGTLADAEGADDATA